ncbi:unnamed protein product [Blepharisma stoltei]|uniref:C2H2-type domain-containing protein n=1 Tax=Blepharisma stoltei TaxID=1481888 RepID=A0AAU9KD54_9CILI|nr:unnamed protein product [Blepharisma stoltei]
MGACSCADRNDPLSQESEGKSKKDDTKRRQKLRDWKSEDESGGDSKDSMDYQDTDAYETVIPEGLKEGEIFDIEGGGQFKIIKYRESPHKTIIYCLTCEVNFPASDLKMHIKNPEHMMNSPEKCVVF